MTKKIQKLSSGIVKKLRSDVAFLNVAHCVEELVLNSIDAGANCIAVHLNLPFYQIQVIDNGCGIDVKQMQMIGIRYATSKCHTLEDLQNLRNGGFRGEALSSLKEVSSILVIESRAASSNETYCKIFTQGKASDPKKSLNSRPSKGTTISVYDFMYNMPVRRNSVSEALDLEECRKLLQSIALMYPNISFTLKNEVTGEMSLQLKKCTSLYHSFLQMFGKNNASNLKIIDYQKDEYGINGCISTDCHISKDLQFLYVNKRQVLRTKLHKLINSILNKALTSRQKSNFNVKNFTPEASSPSKNQSMCIFVLNISCPYDKYDIIFEPRKTMIEFSDWHTVLKIVEESLIDFLRRENLYSNTDASKESMLNVNLEMNFSHAAFDVQDCKQGLFSTAVRRFPPVCEVVNLNADSAANDSGENITHENVELSNVSVYSKSKISKTNFNVSDSTFSEDSSSVVCERNVVSLDRESCICPDTDVSSMYVFDNLKSITSQNVNANCKNLKKFSSDSEKSDSGIPCRSVFPSGSPVMLRIPVKSTLSDLQTCASDSNFLKMKEKFRYLPKKEKLSQLNDSIFAKNKEKICPEVNSTSNRLFFKSSSLSDLHFEFNKERSKINECNKLNTKSSQCPSVSFDKAEKERSNTTDDAAGKERSGLKATKDKSLQCPSVMLEKKARIVSRFRFDENLTKIPFQGLRLLSRTERKSLRKNCTEDVIAVSGDLLNCINNENEISIAKRQRLSLDTLSGNSVSDISNITTVTENNAMDNENLSDVRVKFLSYYCNAHELDDLAESTSVSSTSEDFISHTKETKITNLDQLGCSLFNLQTFTRNENVKKYAQSIHLLTRLDKSHVFEKDKLHSYDIDISTSDPVKNIQNFLPHQIPVRVVEELTSLTEQGYNLLNVDPDHSFKNSSGPVVSDNKHVGIEISEQNDNFENLQLEVPKQNDAEREVPLENEASVLKSINEDMLGICTKRVSSYPVSIKSNMLLSDSDVRKKPDVLNFQMKTFNKNDKVVEYIPVKSSPGIHMQNEDDLDKNSSSHNEGGKHFSRNNSSSCEEKSMCDINFDSNPFTVHLSSASDECSLKQSSSLENEQVSNCISKELFTEPSVAEEVSMDVENLGKNWKSNNPSSEVPACNSSHNFEKEDQNRNSEILEKRNQLNVSDSCSMKDVILPTSASVDKVNCFERKTEYFSDKESKDHHYCWRLHAEPKSNRKVYIDTVTGNSAYHVPEHPDVQVNQNLETNKGVSKKYHFFLTHDYSPFISKTQTPDNKLKDNFCGVQNDLQNFIESKEKHELYKKWRIPGEISNLIGNSVENMLNEWDNPMFNIPYEVTSVADNKFSPNVSQMFSILSSYRFSKGTLSSLQVIGQVDCKFIACILRDFNENCKDQRLLALFDQHAVHERIRLEELIEDLYETNEDGEKSVKTSAINPSLQVQFDDEEINLLHAYHEKLQRIGIHMNIDNESKVCSICSVPACLVHKDSQELRRSVSDSVVILQNCIKEWLSSLLKTRSIPQVLPKTLLSVLNYQACRGAVKFGDPLSLEQCRDLLRLLSGCKLPFQCAHGRPSVAPLLDLKKIEALYKKRSPPQLTHLTS